MERGDLHIDTLGMQLAEAKDLLQKVQEVIVSEQVRTFLAAQGPVPSVADRAATRTERSRQRFDKQDGAKAHTHQHKRTERGSP